MERQSDQDKNAASISREVVVSRTTAKASFNYRNSSWDLIDALKDKVVKLEEIKSEDLPENMQSMTISQKKAYVDSKATERIEIQKRIQELNVQRELYVKAEMDKRTASQNAMAGRGSVGAGMGAYRQELRRPAEPAGKVLIGVDAGEKRDHRARPLLVVNVLYLGDHEGGVRRKPVLDGDGKVYEFLGHNVLRSIEIDPIITCRGGDF